MFAGLTGRGIRVAVIDSGINPNHPHVGGVSGGIAFDDRASQRADYVDRLGHGTAVAAAIREKAPDVELFAVKVFDRSLETSVGALIAAIDWAAEAGMHLVNLSLGTKKQRHGDALRDVVERAGQRRTFVVSARDEDGVLWLPGSLLGVIPVQVDWNISRDRFRPVVLEDATVFRASGYAREIPGVPPQRNLHGVSFAVANMTGFAALAAESALPDVSLSAIVAALVSEL